MSTLGELCQICQQKNFRYTCPKCNIGYCSLSCYKSPQHLKCSEEFYKTCIAEELTSTQPESREDVRKIYEILKRIRESDAGLQPETFDNDQLDEPLDSDDDDDDPKGGVEAGVEEEEVDDEDDQDIATRLQGIDINDADEVWQRLTPSERLDFQQMIECGDIMKLLPDYRPWWQTKVNSKIVDLTAEQEKAMTHKMPIIATNIPKYADICSKSPSPCLHYNLWNILTSYACISRFYGGEQLTSPWEATVHLCNLSATLKYNTNFEDAEDAIVSVEMESLTTPTGTTAAAASATLVESRAQLQQDAKQLMATRTYKLAALSDILQLLQLAKQHVKRAKKEDAEFQKLFAMCSGNVELSRGKLQQLAKKIEFLLAYVQREVNNINKLTFPPRNDFYVNTSQCAIPYVDPFTPELRRIYKSVKPVHCSSTQALVESVYDLNLQRYLLHINETVKRKLLNSSSTTDDDINCCYRQIVRTGSGGNVDKSFKLLPCANFHQDFVVPTHINGIIVDCKSNSTLLQQDAFSFVQQKNATSSNAPSSSPRPSVLMIGIDSMSRINIRRTMKKTYGFLSNNSWFELQGYNKMGDNTYPNLMAVLTGLNVTTAYTKCKPNIVGGLDKCEFIWKLYKSHGYRTAYAEDESTMSTFNYIKKGFVKPPTDYYLRPFMLGVQKTMKIVKRNSLAYCIGRRQAGEYIYDNAMEFAKRYNDEPIFGLFWTNSFSHDSYETPATMDDKMHEYLMEMKKNHILDTSIVIFFSDHGYRWGPLLKLKEGYLEERLPMLFIWLPLWFRNKYPDFVHALQINRHRLTSPYDLHMTLKHILELDAKEPKLEQAQGCAQCQTLFREVPENRTCISVGITEHWCTCVPYEILQKNNKVVKTVSALMIDQMNGYLKSKKLDLLCTKMSLKSIDWAERKSQKVKNTQNLKGENYRIRFSINQKSALFQATAVYNHKENTVHMDVELDISRLNSYANDSGCINDKEAKKFCICKK